MATGLWLGAATLILNPSGASTCPPAVLSGSTFEGADGNMVADCPGYTDWATAPYRNGPFIDKASGSNDDAFGQGTKEDTQAPTIVSGSIPPNKTNLTRFYTGSQFVNNNTYLYLAWERATTGGSVDVDFEFNQSSTLSANKTTPVRTLGDLLVAYDFSGSGSPTIGLAHWVASGTCASGGAATAAAPCWGPITALTSTAEAAVNAGTITDPLNNNATLAAGTFGEAAINLSAPGINLFHTGTCGDLGSVYLKSRSSSSITAEVKDFIAPQKVHISNCGTINITQATENGDASFGYATSGLSPATFSLSNGQTQT